MGIDEGLRFVNRPSGGADIEFDPDTELGQKMAELSESERTAFVTRTLNNGNRLAQAVQDLSRKIADTDVAKVILERVSSLPEPLNEGELLRFLTAVVTSRQRPEDLIQTFHFARDVKEAVALNRERVIHGTDPSDPHPFQTYQYDLEHMRRFVVLGSQAKDFYGLEINLDDSLVHPFSEYVIDVDMPEAKIFRAVNDVRYDVKVASIRVRVLDDGICEISSLQNIGPSVDITTYTLTLVEPNANQITGIQSFDLNPVLDLHDDKVIGLQASGILQAAFGIKIVTGFLYTLLHRAVRIIEEPNPHNYLPRQQRRALERAGRLDQQESYNIYIPATLTIAQAAGEIATGDKDFVRSVRGHERRAHFRRDKYGRKRIRVRDCKVKGGRGEESPYPIYRAENVGMEGIEA